MAQYLLNINGSSLRVDVSPDTPLLWVLRDHLSLKGTKFGCGIAQCGACTVHLNGNPIRSCSMAISAIGNNRVVTIEGLGQGHLHPVQEAWMEADVPQCGYCQAGQIMTASALLAKNSSPSEKEIDQAMAGNICRCGTYPRIKKAIQKAAEKGGSDE